MPEYVSREDAIEFVTQGEFARLFKETYDRLAASDAVEQEQVTDGWAFVKCCVILAAEEISLRHPDHKAMLANLRHF